MKLLQRTLIAAPLFCGGLPLLFLQLFSMGLADEVDVNRRSDLRKALQDSSAAELESRFTAPHDPKAIYVEGARDYLLFEIVQRDKKWSVPLLTKWVEESRKDLEERNLGPSNFELMMALRRAEGLPDPVTIDIDTDEKVLKGNTNQMPVLKVAVKNVDAKKESIMLQQGGDYRTGRPERWRIVLKDEQGREVKPVLFLGSVGGGLSTTGPLEPGETWGTQLSVRSFVETPPPGKYTLQVLFHNHLFLAGMEDIDNLIVCQSKPLDFVMDKLTIETTETDAAVVKRQIADLDGAQPLKIVVGTYDKWAHDTISPNSPAGQLMGMSVIAVPPLVQAVQDKVHSPEKRAWLLSILYSLTGENDPRKYGGVLGSYSYFEGPWQVWSGKNGERTAGGIQLSSSGSMSGGKIDPAKQLDLAAKWQEWLKANCEVREAKAK
jgi:hypothetical protein